MTQKRSLKKSLSQDILSKSSRSRPYPADESASTGNTGTDSSASTSAYTSASSAKLNPGNTIDNSLIITEDRESSPIRATAYTPATPYTSAPAGIYGSFAHGQTQQLSTLLKVSILFPFSKVWKLLSTLTVVTANVFLFWGIQPIFNPDTTLEICLGIMLRIGWLLTFVLLAYWELYRQSISAEIHEFRLNIKRGVFFHKEASVHLLPHTSFYMKQETFFELFFNLCTLNLAVVTTPETDIVTIPGLPVTLAEQLRSYLGNQIDRQLGIRKPEN